MNISPYFESFVAMKVKIEIFKVCVYIYVIAPKMSLNNLHQTMFKKNKCNFAVQIHL